MKPQVPFVDLRRQYDEIRMEIDDAIRAVIDQSAFIGGPFVSSFETAYAKYCGVANVVGVANGTDALELVFEALFGSERGEIIVPANSFVATSEAVSRSGHEVVFADVSPEDYTLDPADVRRRITARTRGVVAVHLYGQPARMEALGAVSEEFGVPLMEDAAQAHGAEVCGRRVGSLATAATFSFYPGKNLGAYGDAGCVTCGDTALAGTVRMLANHGRLAKYDHGCEGRNSRLDGLQAAVLEVKLRHLDGWIARRRSIARAYRTKLAGVGDLILPMEREGVRHVYHLFVVRTAHRDHLRDWLAQRGVSTGVHYPTALPRLKAYASHPQHHEDFEAVRLADQLLSLPIADGLREDEVERVCALITEYFDCA